MTDNDLQSAASQSKPRSFCPGALFASTLIGVGAGLALNNLGLGAGLGVGIGIVLGFVVAPFVPNRR